LKKAVSNGRGLRFISYREALSHPQTVLPGSRIGLNDDSQFFATALDLPEPAGKFCPANRNDWRGHLFLDTKNLVRKQLV
jgi:hypothetical protein